MNKSRQYRGGYQSARLISSAREFRKKSTPAESLLWQHLRNRRFHGFRFRRQHQFGDYVADFYCCDAQLVIECDGNVHTSAEGWNHDQSRDAYMIEQGVRVLRFKNAEVLTDIDAVLDQIAGSLLPSPSGRRVGEEGLVTILGSSNSQ